MIVALLGWLCLFVCLPSCFRVWSSARLFVCLLACLIFVGPFVRGLVCFVGLFVYSFCGLLVRLRVCLSDLLLACLVRCLLVCVFACSIVCL